MSIENRTAVITGAAGGLGAVLAHSLASQDANLALLGRTAAPLETLAQSLAVPGARVGTWAVDLRDPAATQSAAEAVVAKFRRVDILLHLVGGWTGGKPLTAAPSEDLVSMLDQHVWSSFNVAQAFVPHLVKNGWGRIVMISSPFAARPNAKGGPYAIAKAGQETLVLTLAQELKGTGVTANVLLVRAIDLKRAKVSAPAPENASWSTPEELSAAILYLLSDEAGTVSGAKLPMYGGPS